MMIVAMVVRMIMAVIVAVRFQFVRHIVVVITEEPLDEKHGKHAGQKRDRDPPNGVAPWLLDVASTGSDATDGSEANAAARSRP